MEVVGRHPGSFEAYCKIAHSLERRFFTSAAESFIPKGLRFLFSHPLLHVLAAFRIGATPYHFLAHG